MIRWLKAKFDAARAYLRRKVSELRGFLEDLADDAEKYGTEFLALIEIAGPAIEAKVIEVQQVFRDIEGTEKLGKVVDWIREQHGELVPHIKQVRTWISALVAARKVLGLFAK